MTAMVGAFAVPTDSAMIRAAQAGIGTRPVTPPGSIGIDHFSGRCTACHLCVSVCPTQVLRPALFEYGMAGDSPAAHGLLDELLHVRLRALFHGLSERRDPSAHAGPEEGRADRHGEVREGRLHCRDEEEGLRCVFGALSDEGGAHGAVRSADASGVERTSCVSGCGACEHACPTTPRKAIFVLASDEHGRAKTTGHREGGPRRGSSRRISVLGRRTPLIVAAAVPPCSPGRGSALPGSPPSCGLHPRRVPDRPFAAFHMADADRHG